MLVVYQCEIREAFNLDLVVLLIFVLPHNLSLVLFYNISFGVPRYIAHPFPLDIVLSLSNWCYKHSGFHKNIRSYGCRGSHVSLHWPMINNIAWGYICFETHEIKPIDNELSTLIGNKTVHLVLKWKLWSCSIIGYSFLHMEQHSIPLSRISYILRNPKHRCCRISPIIRTKQGSIHIMVTIYLYNDVYDLQGIKEMQVYRFFCESHEHVTVHVLLPALQSPRF